jgi:hypothetical protein
MDKCSTAFAHHLHDTIVQRLAGISLVLAADGPLTPAERALCRREIATGLEELRKGIDVALEGATVPAQLDEELTAFAREHPRAVIDLLPGARDAHWSSVESVAEKVFGPRPDDH